jgi:sulfide:quinone oxidoreductase
VPLANFFRRMQVMHVAAEVTGLRDGGRVVETTRATSANDALVIASGGRFIKKLPGIEHAITPCEGIAAAEKIRDRLRAMPGGTIAVGFAGNPNEPTAVRGGPMFEFLFGIDEQLKREGRREKFELVFFNPSKEPGQRLGPKAVKYLLAEMAKRGIRTHLGHKMQRFEADRVVTEGGEFAADLILFMPGMTGNHWFDQTDCRVRRVACCRPMRSAASSARQNIYVVGDSGSFPGPEWMPKQAHMADLQAAAAAENLLAGLRGQDAQRHLQGRTDLHHRRHRPRHAGVSQSPAPDHPALVAAVPFQRFLGQDTAIFRTRQALSATAHPPFSGDGRKSVLTGQGGWRALSGCL